jgi:spore germination protein
MLCLTSTTTGMAAIPAVATPATTSAAAIPEGATQGVTSAAAVTPAAISEGIPAAATLAATTPVPLQAFVLTGAPDSFADLQAHVGALDVIYPTYFECAVPSGALVGAANPEVDAYAGVHHLVELPRYTCQDGAIVHRILTEPALRGRTLAQLVALAASPAYAGLNLDLENDGPSDRGALSLFVQTLARDLHAEHRRLAVDVVGVVSEPIPRPAAGFYNYRAISANADTVFVMAWGTHWEGSPPGPIAPLSYVQGVARFVSSLPYASRFVLGVPMYGLDWPIPNDRPGRASALEYAEVQALARSVGATPARDPSSDELTFAYTRARVPHRIWYMDAQAILDCLRIARANGLQAGVWRLGEEDQSLWASPGI